MSDDRYPKEVLPSSYGELDDDMWTRDFSLDNGTMPANVDYLLKHVVGRRIVKCEHVPVEHTWRLRADITLITLDDGTTVRLADSEDCCAYTEVQAFLLHPELVDHVIIGVGTTEAYQRWHIYADLGDVLELTVGWSAGNAFYYGYGFAIDVVPAEGGAA